MNACAKILLFQIVLFNYVINIALSSPLQLDAASIVCAQPMCQYPYGPPNQLNQLYYCWPQISGADTDTAAKGGS